MDKRLPYQCSWLVNPRSVEIVPEKVDEVRAAIDLKAPNGNPAATALAAVELAHFCVRIPPATHSPLLKLVKTRARASFQREGP